MINKSLSALSMVINKLAALSEKASRQALMYTSRT